MPMTVVLFILECEHIMPGYETTSGAEVCKICNRARKVEDVHVYEWRANCRNCNYARWTGLSQKTAERMADNHARNSNHPKIRVEYAQNPLAIKARKRLVDLKLV